LRRPKPTRVAGPIEEEEEEEEEEDNLLLKNWYSLHKQHTASPL